MSIFPVNTQEEKGGNTRLSEHCVTAQLQFINNFDEAEDGNAIAIVRCLVPHPSVSQLLKTPVIQTLGLR